jgi:CelD/BcsL family acetyltransferase involved in cellulose biosynthesis
MLRLERVEFGGNECPTDTGFNVFTSREWVEFVAATQNAEPVVARVVRDGEQVGWFTGLVVRRFGVRILGSPFSGWMTGPMGFDLAPGVSRSEATRALMRFAFKDLRCLHVEMVDRHVEPQDLEGLGGRLGSFYTLELDLTQDEDALLKGMSSSCRRALKKAQREGVRVEEAHGVEFADEYYEQLLDVFAKQGGRPPYDLERVRQLIRSLEPAGHLLMLRALEPGGERMATAIFPFGEGFAYFWGGASWRRHQIHRPNESIFWHAIRDFKKRGIPLLDMGGGGDFKRKFGPLERDIPSLRRSRVPGLMAARDLAATFYWRKATGTLTKRAPRRASRAATAADSRPPRRGPSAMVAWLRDATGRRWSAVRSRLLSRLLPAIVPVTELLGPIGPAGLPTWG